MGSLTFLVLSVCVALASSERYLPTWDSIDNRPLPAWYDEAKFGIFMHWGVYSVPSYGGGDVRGTADASEWFWWQWHQNASWAVDYMEKNFPPDFKYADFGPMFTAEFFNPDAWADIFKGSGAQYVVLTSKHHEGFTNWPSKTSWNWNSFDTGPHRDLVGDLAASIRNRTSIRFGLYFSLFEFFHPIYLQDKANGFKSNYYPTEISSVQLQEIVNTYHPEVIWSDGDWEAPYTYWNSTEFLAWLYNESPVKDTIVVNDRWGSGMICNHGGYHTCADRYDPGVLQKHKWENAMTVDGASWGFRREMALDSILTIEQLISDFIKTVSCGGNLLLNVGPTHEGTIVPIFQERLSQIGSWLAINGEGIYKTTYWTYQNDTYNPDVWYTYKPAEDTVYATALKYPASLELTIGAVVTGSNSRITLLGLDDQALTWVNHLNGITINLPALPASSQLKWGWTFKLVRVLAR